MEQINVRLPREGPGSNEPECDVTDSEQGLSLSFLYFYNYKSLKNGGQSMVFHNWIHSLAQFLIW